MFPAYVSPIGQATAFKGFGKLLTDFASKYENYPTIQASGHVIEKMYHTVWKRVLITNILILPISACFAINIVFLYGKYLTIEVACLYVVAMVIQWYLCFMPPSSSGDFLKSILCTRL